MAKTQLSGKKLVTDRVVAIVFLCLGVLFELVWFVPSLMSVMWSDAGVTPGLEIGIYTVIFGPILAVIAFTVTTIVFLVLNRRAMIFGILTLVAPIAVVALGVGLALMSAPQ